MNIETLKVFRDLYDTGSFSKTAELNYVSQSAVSQQIKKLELVLKCKLYHRPSGRISLTPGGEKFYEASKKIAAMYDGALAGIRALGADRDGEEIKISTIYSAGIYMIQNYIKRFLAQKPGTKISVEYRQFSQIYSDVTSGRADFGFMACPYLKSPGLSMLPVAKDEMVLIAGSSSPLAGRRKIRVRDLDGMDFIFFDKVFPSRRHIDDFLRSHNVKCRVKMELDNIETIKTAVASGAGVSLLPRSAVREEENGINLHVLRISDARFLRPIYLIHSRTRELSRAARSFMEIFPGVKPEKAGV
ncbi:MAG: LysR family transcriptional regulator [Elusimicrobia bacterium CG08_land_8_20_14_0_20_59_10]|nr:MAG: LysR family transcriptional regulator [Elusimicrobia bacterium CG08_land_8_20_14_0_20_59_10]